jgi:hypothetical protein
MPKIGSWRNFPAGIKSHLVTRMLEREITKVELTQLRLWVESNPELPTGDWYKDFGSFKICGRGSLPKTFLLRGQPATGEPL